jgi:hypothetical protein
MLKHLPFAFHVLIILVLSTLHIIPGNVCLMQSARHGIVMYASAVEKLEI